MVERSQVWFPNDLSRTIYLCTWPLFLLQWKVKNKCLPWYYHSLYTGQRKYILWLYYPEFLELGTGTCRASASSMLREGDLSHVQDTTKNVMCMRKNYTYLHDTSRDIIFNEIKNLYITYLHYQILS